MKRVKKLRDESIYIEVAEMLRIANEAIAEARTENRRLGLKEVYSEDGNLYYWQAGNLYSIKKKA